MNTKKAKRYSVQFSRALKSVPKLEPKELAVQEANGKLKKIAPEDVRVNGTTYKTYIDIHNQTVQELNEVKHTVKDVYDSLASIFIDKGYEYTSEDLKSLSAEISLVLQIIDKNKKYIGITKDVAGYVTGVHLLSDIVEHGIDVPDDYNKGYWKFENGRFTLDQEKYRQYWSV